MRKTILAALLCTVLTVNAYEPYRGHSNSYKNMSSAVLAGIIYQKASINTMIFSDDAVEPLLNSIFKSSDEFYDNFDKDDFVKALTFYKSVGHQLKHSMPVTDEFRDFVVQHYINDNCGI